MCRSAGELEGASDDAAKGGRDQRCVVPSDPACVLAEGDVLAPVHSARFRRLPDQGARGCPLSTETFSRLRADVELPGTLITALGAADMNTERTSR